MNPGVISRFSLPTEILYGINCVSMLGSEIKRLGGNKAFFVTGNGVSASGILNGAYQPLKEAGVSFLLFENLDK